MKKADASAVVRRAGLRATEQRTRLFSYLNNMIRPQSVQELTEGLGASADVVTVYRMLAAFKRAGLVREVNLRGEHPRYEMNDEHDHHHIICTDCGRVEDFIDEAHERIGKRVLSKSKAFKQITGHSFDLYGLCKSCA